MGGRWGPSYGLPRQLYLLPVVGGEQLEFHTAGVIAQAHMFLLYWEDGFGCILCSAACVCYVYNTVCVIVAVQNVQPLQHLTSSMTGFKFFVLVLNQTLDTQPFLHTAIKRLWSHHKQQGLPQGPVGLEAICLAARHGPCSSTNYTMSRLSVLWLSTFNLLITLFSLTCYCWTTC